MSDCANGGRGRSGDTKWHVPKPEDREPGVLYQHPTYARKFYECLTAIEVYGIRFEPVAECEMTTEFEGYPCNDYRCSACSKVHSAPRAHERCPRCGAKVTMVDGKPV